MKLPSIEQVSRSIGRTFMRFPAVLLTAAAGTCAAIALIDTMPAHPHPYLFNVLCAALPGIPLLIALALTAEKEAWGRMKSALLQCAALLALAAYAVSLPSNLAAAPSSHIMRLLLLVTAMHLLVAFLPYFRRGGTNGFWNYNMTMLLRVPVSVLFTLVLYAGLAIAMAALNNLFGMDIPGKRYAQLFMLLGGVFTTWFYLSGIPADLNALDEADTYPKGLKVFAQYIIFPLALIYLVILYAYAGKILIEWNWPHGWVSMLVLGFAVTGTFTLLLLHPIRDTAGNAWIRRAWRWYHIVLIPLVVMVFFAVSRRIGEYGLTEGRYLVVVLGIWCSVMILYFLFSRGRSIKAIPFTLCVFALAISCGPWGMLSMSERSQVARLESLLTRHSMLVNSRVRAATAPLTGADAREIGTVLLYLGDVHGYGGIQPWFAEPLMDAASEDRASRPPQDVARMLGIEYVENWASAEKAEFTLETGDWQALALDGYDRLLATQAYSPQTLVREYTEAGITVRASRDLNTLTVLAIRDKAVIDSVRFDMNALASRMIASFGRKNIHDIPPDSMTAAAQGARISVKLRVALMNIRRDGGKLTLPLYRVGVLYRMLPE